MPEIAADVDHADLLAWLVEPGEPVNLGDPILEIETDKATVEIEAPASGILAEIRVPAGSVDVAAGAVLGLIEESVRDSAESAAAEPPRAPEEEEVPTDADLLPRGGIQLEGARPHYELHPLRDFALRLCFCQTHPGATLFQFLRFCFSRAAILKYVNS